ncbi:MAG: dynamin family protein [Acidimicrobiales bacterium]
MTDLNPQPPDDLTPEKAQQFLTDYAQDLKRYANDLRTNGLDVPVSIESTVDALIQRIPQRPEVMVALLGGTGAGKSTLVNALLECRLLPVSSMKACTSAITEVAFSPTGFFEADIEFIDRSDWHNELALLEQDLFDARERQSDSIGISKAAEDKIRAVYGELAANRYLVSLDREDLIEPEEIRDAFDRGVHVIEAEEDSYFRDMLAKYLSSDYSFWPIVKRVRVQGPFEKLEDGAVLVDLPGLNDPNQAREEATKDYLRSARFVWVVFNMKRALTRDVFDFLRDGDLLRRLYMDGRTGSLHLVGTAADDIDADADIEQFDLAPDSEDRDIVHARSSAVRQVVREQLDELAELIGRDAGAESSEVGELRTQLSAAPIHCVSAREYQKCVGIMQKRKHMLRVPADTGIPQLQEASRTLVSDHGQEAHLNQIYQELQSVADELSRVVQTRITRIQAQALATKQQLSEVTAAAGQATSFLEERTNRSTDRFDESIATAANVLTERLQRAGSDAALDIRDLEQIWRGMNWATVRATARRGGTWSSRDRTIDFNRQISKPLLDRISFAWVEFFGHRATTAVETLTHELGDASTDFVDVFARACRQFPELDQVFAESGKATMVASQNLVSDRLTALERQVASRLESDRRQIDERVKEFVETRMSRAFAAAAADRGQGTLNRMVNIIIEAAIIAADQLLDDVTELVAGMLDSLTSDLSLQVAEVGRGIRAEAETLTSTVTTVAEASNLIEHSVDDLDDLTALLAGLPTVEMA